MQDLYLPALVFLLKLFKAGIAYICLRLVLKQLDKVLDFNFKEWLGEADDKSKAIYLGSRFIGTCFFFAYLLG